MPTNALLYHRRPQPKDAPEVRAEALYEEAGRLRQSGKLDDAIAAYDQALKLRPAFPEALRAGGCVLRDLGYIDGALAFFAEALRHRPTYLDAVLDRGNLLCQLLRLEEAFATFDTALATLPDCPALLINKGIVLHELGRLPEAHDVLVAAVAKDPTSAKAHLNHGNVLARQFRHADALPAFERALSLQPDYSAAHTGRGLALKMLGRFGEAAPAFEAALALEPDNPFALKNRGELRLLLGDRERGLRDYEARLRTYAQDWPRFRQPPSLWSGHALAGQRVLAIADDGSGDVIQFARYVPRLVAAGAAVTVICRPRLQRLLRSVTRGTSVVTGVDETAIFDLLIPFSSLPFVFAAEADAFAAKPYLAAEADAVAAWALRLGARGFKIGLCWRGSQDWRADPNRSLRLSCFDPLAAVPGVRLISLQVDEGDESATVPWLERLEALDAGADAFIDTAAVMANLDLVVTCDTSIAHLAGALGRPTAVLLRTVPEWRWMLGRADSPWYPTMQIFRQSQPGAWQAPVEQLVAAVRKRLPAA